MMVFPDAVIALRDFLTRRSDLSQHQPPPQTVQTGIRAWTCMHLPRNWTYPCPT